MKKAGICTIVILVFAALAVWIYRSGNHDEKTPVQGKGTLVKEYNTICKNRAEYPGCKASGYIS